MDKGAPSVTRIITMVLFALSCFGLLLFLWLAFGGPVPFRAKGYQIKVAFPNAAQLAGQADVRIAGVSIGKVVDKQLDPNGNRTLATLEIQRQYAPIRSNAIAILRQKTILGETYVDLSPGSPNAPPIPDGGVLNRTQVQHAVQLDEIFNALDPHTRQSFQIWQQELARAVTGNDQNLNSVLGNLPSFAADATDITRVLDIEHLAVVRLLQNGGIVFNALSRDQTALRSLITTGETTFATTAAQNVALADTFQTFPSFLNETKATMARLKTFSLDTDPLVKALMPAANDLGPTLHSVRLLSPDLRNLFVQLDPLITASKTGLPAVTRVIHGATPLLAQLGPFLEQLNPILTWLSTHQALISDFIAVGGSALAQKTTSFAGGGTGHSLPQYVTLGPETLSLWPTRDPNNRGNTYPPPTWSQGPLGLQINHQDPPSWDCNNTGKGEVPPNTAPVGGFPACWVAPPLGPLIGQNGKMAHVLAAQYPAK
jgi:phospholipid/cholesterol/gamma-HCH transport system substrate-binding protein